MGCGRGEQDSVGRLGATRRRGEGVSGACGFDLWPRRHAAESNRAAGVDDRAATMAWRSHRCSSAVRRSAASRSREHSRGAQASTTRAERRSRMMSSISKSSRCFPRQGRPTDTHHCFGLTWRDEPRPSQTLFANGLATRYELLACDAAHESRFHH